MRPSVFSSGGEVVSRNSFTNLFARPKEKLIFSAIRLREAWVAFDKQAVAERETALVWAWLMPAWGHYIIGTVLFAVAAVFVSDTSLTKDEVWLIFIFGLPSASISRYVILPIFPDLYAWLYRRCCVW